MIIYDKKGRGNLPIQGDPKDHDRDRDEWCKKKSFYGKWLCEQKYKKTKRDQYAAAQTQVTENVNIEKEFIMTLSDWYEAWPSPYSKDDSNYRRYHDQLGGPNGLINYYLSAENNAAGGAEPIPKSTLINDQITDTFDLKPGKKYLFRIINMSALAAHFVEFDAHNMTVVAVDGVPTKPKITQTIRLTPAQRYDVVIEAKRNATMNYSFITQMDNDLFDTEQPDSVTIGNGILRYSSKSPDPPKLTTHGTPIDDITLYPADGQKILGKPDHVLNFTINFGSVAVAGQEVQR
jgi:iron transport multicopper oxidase